MTRRPAWQWLAVAGFAAWVVIAALQWLAAAPLGHDEAQYALAAKDLLHGAEPRWFYLSPGMNVVAVPGLVAGGGTLALRVVPLLAGLGFIVLVAGLARRVACAPVAAWTVALLAGARPLIQRSTELLSDVPSTACMIALVWLLVSELERDEGPRWRLIAAAPLAAAAFYVRFGSCVPIALIGGAALLVYGRAILRRPLPVLATTALLALLLVQHALAAKHLTGQITGILRLSKEVPGETGGLVTYLSEPVAFYGMWTIVPMLAGVAALARRRDRTTIFLWLVAVGDIIVMGLITQAQARYVFLGSTLLVILGVDLLVGLAAKLPSRAREIAGAVVVAAIATSWLSTAHKARRYPDGVRRRMEGTFAAASAIGADRGGKDCFVIGRHETQLEWYSGCTTALEPDAAAMARGVPVYVVRDSTGGAQPDFAAMPGKHRTIFETPAASVIVLER